VTWWPHRRRDRTIRLDHTGLDAATAARKKAERRWPHVNQVANELREQRIRNGFAERVTHALEGR
jgi:hypothetical protein